MHGEPEAAAFRAVELRAFADGLSHSSLDVVLSSLAINRMHDNPGEEIRQQIVEVANSVIDALQWKDSEKGGDEESRGDHLSDNHHQELDGTLGDHGFGSPGNNAWSPGSPARSLDDLVSGMDLLESPGGLGDTLLPGPLADSLFLDGWRDGIPPARPNLVPAGGQDLTVIATYLVGSPSQALPPPLSPPVLESGATDFIVGLANPTRDQPPTLLEATRNVPTLRERVEPRAPQALLLVLPPADTGESRSSAVDLQPQTSTANAAAGARPDAVVGGVELFEGTMGREGGEQMGAGAP